MSLALLVVVGMPTAMIAAAYVLRLGNQPTAPVDKWHPAAPALITDTTWADAWDQHVAEAVALTESTPIHDELAVENLRRDLNEWGRG